MQPKDYQSFLENFNQKEEFGRRSSKKKSAAKRLTLMDMIIHQNSNEIMQKGQPMIEVNSPHNLKSKGHQIRDNHRHSIKNQREINISPFCDDLIHQDKNKAKIDIKDFENEN